jgi:hypothetical protein
MADLGLFDEKTFEPDPAEPFESEAERLRNSWS